MKLTQVFEKKCADIEKLIQAGTDAFAQAGKKLVELIDEFPETKEIIMTRNPKFRMEALNRLEAIGRGSILPELAFDEREGVKALRRLPLSDQKKYMAEPLELVVVKDGKNDTLLVAVTDLTASQAKQVFSAEHIRTLGAQRAYLEEQRMKQAQKNPSNGDNVPAWQIRKDRVIFNSGATLTAGELATIITQLTR